MSPTTAARDDAVRHLCRPWTPVDADEQGRVSIVRGEGCYVFDRAGTRYLDARSGNLSVTCGYSCEPIRAAIRQQLDTLPVFDTISFDVDVTTDYAAALAAAMPQPISRIFLTNSGSEAAECAVVLARAFADAHGNGERRVILRLDLGYHGTTPSALAATQLPGNDRPAADQPPGFATIASDWQTLDDALAAVDTTVASVGAGRVAAILVEPILGIAGVIVPPEGFVRRLARKARQCGALLIVDEVLCGMGRTGRLFAAEDVEADIVLASKGLTSGYVPLAAVGMSQRVHAALAHDPVIGGLRYGHTSSGHALACAAGLAALTYTVDEDLPGNSARRGASLLAELAGLSDQGGVREVRGRGLLIGVEFETAERAAEISETMLSAGVIVRHQGPVITLAPPLVLDEEQGETIASAMAQAVRL